jgi:hypothetical protein
MSKPSTRLRALTTRCLLPFTTLALLLSSACVTRPLTVTAPPPLCPDKVLDELLSPTPGADLPGQTFGAWVAFAVQAEAARLSRATATSGWPGNT